MISMTAKETAKELFDKMASNIEEYGWRESAIECAKIAVDEILEATKQPRRTYNTTNHGSTEISGYYYSDFWKEVKIEIEKL